MARDEARPGVHSPPVWGGPVASCGREGQWVQRPVDMWTTALSCARRGAACACGMTHEACLGGSVLPDAVRPACRQAFAAAPDVDDAAGSCCRCAGAPEVRCGAECGRGTEVQGPPPGARPTDEGGDDEHTLLPLMAVPLPSSHLPSSLSLTLLLRGTKPSCLHSSAPKHAARRESSCTHTHSESIASPPRSAAHACCRILSTRLDLPHQAALHSSTSAGADSTCAAGR